MDGLVVRNTGSWYEVRTEDGRLVPCKVKGNFRLKGIRSTSPVAVGDQVRIQLNQEDTAFICEVLPRRNYIIRRASNLSKQSHILAANIDTALLVVTLAHPETSTIFVDRFIASAEAYRIPCVLLFNKVDLLDADQRRRVGELAQLYESIGYPSLIGSVTQGLGLDLLTGMLHDKVTLIAGNSGVGKSALLNWLVPTAHAQTAPISESRDTGTHTTTFSQLYDLPGGGAVIDVPGVKGFGTFDFEPEEISSYFREIFETGRQCRFSNCLHLEEPGCAVRQAVGEGRIARSRYEAYLSMLGDKDEDRYRPAY